MDPNKRPPLTALTGVRFFAALAVVLTHLLHSISAPQWLRHGSEVGSAGVSFFFVLSGFILTFNYGEAFSRDRSRSRLRAFFRARLARVYPMHLITLLAITPWTVFKFGGAGLAGSWLSHALLIQAWLPVPELARFWNEPSWSISNEAFFYAVFPFCVATLWRWRSPGRLWSLAVLLYAAELAGFGFVLLAAQYGWTSLSHDDALNLLAYRNPLTRVFEFLIGCVVGRIYLGSRDLPTEQVRNAIVVGSLLFVSLVAGLTAANRVGGARIDLTYVLFTPAFVAIIYCLASGRTIFSTLLESPLCVLLGEASYSLYLIHWMPRQLIEQHYRSGAVPPALGIAAMLACIPASVFCHRYIESPARAWLRNPAPANPRQFVAAAS